MKHHPFIVYLKNKTSVNFEYKRDVLSVVQTDNGYRVTFREGKSYNYRTDNVRFYPFVSRRKDVRIYEHGKLNKKYDTVDSYGRYLIFRAGDNCSYPVEDNANIEICDAKKDTSGTESIINYFRRILKENIALSFDIQGEELDNKNPNQVSSEILLKALDGIDILESRSALSNYINGVNTANSFPGKTLIYPFGCNESQRLAVMTALNNGISIVEGPPGTGKTQTILNIVANLIVQNKTVAIVSNNNAAVFNIREKLEKYGYEMVAASLGNNDNKALFFDNIKEQAVGDDFEVPEERLKKAVNKARDLEPLLTRCFQFRNKLAILETELSDALIEFSHLKAEQPLDQDVKSILDKKFFRKWNFSKALKFKKTLSIVDLENKLSIIKKLRLILQYGLIRFNSISQHSKELPVYVNHRFYELYIENLKSEILRTENWLASNNIERNLNRFVEVSRDVFNGVLFKKYSRLDKVVFNINNYRSQFGAFTNRYPVILSSTLSLHSSIPKGYLFDYLVIDESSQVDIIKSAVCFSCCRNVVVVGDSMQLSHIVDKQTAEVAKRCREECGIPIAYDYVQQNILDSLKAVYKDKIKQVLLREHYRCHPTIIGFCNKKYYNDNLVIMTSRDNHPFRIIETNIAGGRGNYSQRQIDETDLYIRDHYSADYTGVGVIAPYREHVTRLQRQLSEGIEADTIHKFQGREKDVVIFNTVKDKIGPFIDNPNLINVAVSRAVKEFIVVKPVSMELPHGTNIGDLIRYMCYTTDPAETIVKGRICSVFDLLYKEYNKVFMSILLYSKKSILELFRINRASSSEKI